MLFRSCDEEVREADERERKRERGRKGLAKTAGAEQRKGGMEGWMEGGRVRSVYLMACLMA